MANPILPVKVVESADLEENGGVYLVKKGAAAIPIHGFTAQGNRAVEGAARPVYVVSEAEFNAGDFVKGRGQPRPVGDIDDLGYVGALEGREAIPVWAVNDWPVSGVVPFVGAYDDIPNLVHVYEPARRTLTSYTGPLVRIRRSSDNVEQDFGSLANGDLDNAAITTFLGGSSGFVVTVYDQVGSNNPTQATAGSQPAYVASGQNGKPSMRSSGGTIQLFVTFSTAVTQPYITYVLGKSATSQLSSGLTAHMIESVAGTRMTLRKSGVAPGVWGIVGGATLNSVTNCDDNYNIFSALFNSTNSQLWLNNTSIAAGNAGGFNPTGITLFSFSTPGTLPWIGDIASIAIANPSHDTTEREAMESAINNYWAVY